jgi:hypothetical protein
MLTPQRIAILRTSAAPRRHIPVARPIRRPVDTVRLKAVWRAEIYGALLLLEERAEQSRDALQANDDAAAAAIIRALAHAPRRSAAPSTG